MFKAQQQKSMVNPIKDQPVIKRHSSGFKDTFVTNPNEFQPKRELYNIIIEVKSQYHNKIQSW